MLKFFSFGKNQSGVLITLLVIIALGACYFFLYLPKNERTVQERRFRCLRKVDLSLRDKIQTSRVLITNLLNDYDRYKDGKQDAGLKKLRKYISGYSTKNFTLLLPERAEQYFNPNHDSLINSNHDNLTYMGDDDLGNKFYIDVGSQITLLVKKEKNNGAPKSKSGKTRETDTVIGMRYDFNQFVSSLLLTGVFDYYAVFVNKKKIYEDYPSGLNFNDPDSLLSVKNKITTPGLRSLQIGETDFKVFSHPVYTSSGSKWIITGLLKNDNYQKEKDQLPLWLLLLLATAAIAMLVSLPLIKLYHMGSKDRLSVADGVGSILVSMILLSLLFFAFFKYRVDLKKDALPFNPAKKYHEHYAKDDYSRNVLAEKITNAFAAEINLANTVLASYQNLHKKGDPDIHLLGKGTGGYDNLYKKYASQMHIREVFWLDPSGSETTNLTIDSTNDPKGHYNNRRYFKSASLYQLGNYSFYLDQVFSYTDGTFRSIISQKIKKDGSVIAMSFNMKSLTGIVIPDGYQFAIISNGGWVLYHSKPTRNLVDNLLQEVSNKDLMSSIKAQSDTSFKAAYYGKLYNIKIKPVPGLPAYFTVIFEDVDYNDVRDTEAYTFTLSMLVGMLVFLVIKYLIVFVVSSSRSFFKRQHFDTSWLGPHKLSHHEYNVATIANAIIILVLILFFNHSSFFQYLYILLIGVVFTSLFLNLIFAEKYRNTNPYKYKYKIKAVKWLCGLLVLIDISAYFNLIAKHWYILIGYELIFILVFPLIFISAGILLKKARQYKTGRSINWTFTHSYALMVVTRLIISSGIPAVFFFIYSFNYEQNLDIRYRQLAFANALVSKANINKNSNIADVNKYLDSIKNNSPLTAGIYSDGLLIADMKVESGKDIDETVHRISTYTDEDLLTAGLLNAFRLHTNDLEVQNAYLNLPFTGDNVFFSKLNKQSGDSSPVQLFYQLAPKKYLIVSSLAGISYQNPHILFWILLLAALVVFYFVIHRVITKIFALNLHYHKSWGKLDSELLKENNFNSKVLIVGSPGSGTLQKLIYKIKAKKIKSNNGSPLVISNSNPSNTNAFIANMMLISAENGEADPEWKRHRKETLAGNGLVIINHFEYNIRDARVNKIKLDLLESLIAQNTSKVIIISTVHPLIFLDSFSEPQDQVSETERGRWHVLLGYFHVVIDPLITSGVPQNTAMPEKAIIEETQYSRFLHKMQADSLNFLKSQISSISSDEKTQGRITDSLIFKIQVTSQYFYTDIWQSLTMEEKFLLYDLAEDGLVNSFDEFNLSLLMSKGLIVDCDGALILFNRGFRNFILTAIGKKEVDRIKDQLKDNGRWGNLKGPLSLAILAILVFLFYSQQEEYTQIITYITAFSAGIPAVLKIFSIFGPGSSQKAA